MSSALAAEPVRESRRNPGAMIFRAIIDAKRSIGAVGKLGKATDGAKYDYRKFEDVMNAVSPAMDEFGLIVVPKLLSSTERMSQTKNGSSVHFVQVRVKFTFFAEDGSSVVAVTEGEAFDSGDKARTKAQTVAFRIVLCELFNIAYNEMEDPESGPQHEFPRENPEMLRRVIGRLSRCTDTKTLNALLQYVALCASGQGPAGEVLSQAQVKQLRQHFGDAGDRCRLSDKNMLQLLEEVDGIAREPYTDRSTPMFESEPVRFAELDLQLSQAKTKAHRDRAVMTAMQSSNLKHISVEEFGELFAKHFPDGVTGEENEVGAIVAQAAKSTTIDELASHTRSIDGMRLHGKIDEKVAEYILGMFAKKIRLMQEQRGKGATDANGG